MAALVQKFNPARFWGTRFGSILITLAVLYAVQILVIPKLNGYDVRILTLGLFMATLAVTLNIINGITGQFSMGHAAFYVIGAYAGGKLTQLQFKGSGWDPQLWLVVALFFGALVAGIAGLVVGLPSLRLKGDYLAIVTMGFGEIVRIFINNQDGGKDAIMGLDLGGSYQLNLGTKITQFWHVGLLLVIAMALSRNLLKTVHGLAFLATREDELAASAVGVNTTKTKVAAFVLGAALAGAAGVLFAHFNQTVAPDDGSMAQSFLIVAMVVIGGMGSITGAAIAGFALSIVPEVLRKFPPISAIDLMGLVLGVIVAVVLANQLKRFKVTSSPGWKVFMNFLGVIFCALLAYGAFKNFQSGVSPVIKAVFITLTLVVLVGLAFTTGRRTLPGFGYFLFLVGVVVAFQFPIVKLLHKIPVIETNLASTTYTPSDLRWALFAVTLIVVMLARPQGILGHHELSWTAVGKMFGYRGPEKAVAA
jgi:branched-chain amino acid transport system permease protein